MLQSKCFFPMPAHLALHTLSLLTGFLASIAILNSYLLLQKQNQESFNAPIWYFQNKIKVKSCHSSCGKEKKNLEAVGEGSQAFTLSLKTCMKTEKMEGMQFTQVPTLLTYFGTTVNNLYSLHFSSLNISMWWRAAVILQASTAVHQTLLSILPLE